MDKHEMKELIQILTPLAETPWETLRDTLLALLFMAWSVRRIIDWFPFLPQYAKRATTWAISVTARAVSWSFDQLRDAMHVKYAKEPKWLKPMGHVVVLVAGGYFAFVAFVEALWLFSYALLAEGDLITLPKRSGALIVGVLVLVMMRILSVNARDASCQLQLLFRKGES